MQSSEPLYYGSRCDRYNLKKKIRGAKEADAFEYRTKRLFDYAGIDRNLQKTNQTNVTIGIPMALINWQLLPLFAQFFKEIGFDVVVSKGTNKKIIQMGTETITAQPCFPVKVAHGHIADLIEKGVDYIFLPSIVSMTADFPINKHNQLCPYVQSLAYQVKTAFHGKLGKTKMLTVPIRLGQGDRLLRKSFISLGKKLGVSASKVRGALKNALIAQDDFEKALKQKGKEILANTAPDEKLFVLVSRPYNGCDVGLNLQIPRKLAELGVKAIPMDMLDLDEAELSDPSLHRDLYWTYGQKILRAAEIISKDRRLFAVYLSNFGCGPDSFILTFFKDIMSPKPCLQLELDEHSADAGIITRLEAYLESLKHYLGQTKIKKHIVRSKKKAIDLERKLYIPYMSDCSYGLAACFRAYGQQAQVIPMADEYALLLGKSFTTGKECLPCAITVGNMLKIIKAADFDPEAAAFFMPGSCGPCRFGMYNCMHKLILRYAGAPNVPVIAPNQDGSFYKEFTQTVEGTTEYGFMKDVWTATVGIDLLSKLILRLRPFAVNRCDVQKVYQRSMERWLTAVECKIKHWQMHRLMSRIADDFANVQLRRELRKPRIGVVGEIYVRSHPFANMNIIARLEELGAVCDLASVAEWVYYTNFTRKQAAWRKRKMGSFFSGTVQNLIQHKIEKRLAQPLEKRFGPLAEESTENTIEQAKIYMHRSFEGEAILSIGKMIEYHHRGIGGIVNVMPFGCMPSTIVSSQARRISTDCDNMPILNLSFDGQDDAMLETRLEAFVEQVRQRQDCVLTAADVKLSLEK
jgi:predicted nucleotide-binding protein (sugar kinase/HSP70/actin superfamily)